MEVGYELFVSWRYLRSKRKEVFISLNSIFSISGVALGVMALIIVLAVMTGLIDGLRDKILGTDSHIIISKGIGALKAYPDLIQQISQKPRVVGAAPFIFGQVMIQSNSASAEVTLKGIDLQAEQKTSDLAAHMQQGKLDFLEPTIGQIDNPGYGILIGGQLAQKLQVSVGETVALISPMKDSGSSWPVPKREVFQITGIFDYGMYNYDLKLAYISLASAQAYFQTGDIATGIGVKVNNIFHSKRVARELQEELGHAYYVRDWTEIHKPFFALFGFYKKALFVMLLLIVLVACLNIASTLIMMVMEKNKDIAVLKSIGASSRDIGKMFIMQGGLIGFVGTGIGCILGFLVCWIADTYHIIRLEGGVYYLNYLPFKMTPLHFILVAAAAILICFGATLYPAIQAAKLDPAVALRCE
ncbi:MAG: lipoprotein-releasing ABC transporter permease subunit [Anaerolineales bacterium]